MRTVRLLDYGVGNIHSLTKALQRSGLKVDLAPVDQGPGEADGLVLPGVGAFEPAASSLAPVRSPIVRAIADGRPTLGICLGMQLFAHGSEEGAGQGLGIVDGMSRSITHPRVPHIGWNTLEGPRSGPLAELDGRHVYYVHSYALPAGLPDVTATTTYGEPFAAIMERDQIIATQFHPEKSSAAGRIVIDAFRDMVEAS